MSTSASPPPTRWSTTSPCSPRNAEYPNTSRRTRVASVMTSLIARDCSDFQRKSKRQNERIDATSERRGRMKKKKKKKEKRKESPDAAKRVKRRQSREG